MEQKEIHPWKWYAPRNSTKLIVGTFPSQNEIGLMISFIPIMQFFFGE